ncbi:LlaJI family restriction endonuclease [Clostridium saudiense]|uniref:LlaJI family restriction endonuclease n=1 Tax=Clostridium saudiense TaxID=1414720 RepID=UPI0018A90330|nr:LlaJI family restriction endonuclease [Clostridium saudiense]
MKSIDFIENEYMTKKYIIDKTNIDNISWDELLYKRIIKKSDKSEQYCFNYVGLIYKSGSIIYVLPKVLEKNVDYSLFKEKLIKLFIIYSKRENLLVDEKEFLGVDNSNNKGSLISVINYIMEDYINNGLYIKKSCISKINGNGEIDWRKTIERNSIFINGNRPIYNEIITKNNYSHNDLLITQIHKKIINKCNSFLRKSTLENILKYDIEDFELDNYYIDDDQFILEELQKEMDIQFEDKKVELLEVLVNFIKKVNLSGEEFELTLFGTRSFQIVWEKINSYVLNNKYDEISLNIPKPKWYSIHGKKPIQRKTLIPDILYINENVKTLYILDAKYYTTDFKENKLIGTVQGIEDIVKQLVYEDVLSKVYVGYSIINAFIIPTIKRSNKFGMVEFPISNTSQTVQLIHMNIFDVIDRYMKNKKYIMEEWLEYINIYNTIDKGLNDKLINKSIITSDNMQEDLVRVGENVEIYSNYIENNNIKIGIVIKLLMNKFKLESDECLNEIKYLSEKKLDEIIDNIFNINTLNDLQELFN